MKLLISYPSGHVCTECLNNVPFVIVFVSGDDHTDETFTCRSCLQRAIDMLDKEIDREWPKKADRYVEV